MSGQRDRAQRPPPRSSRAADDPGSLRGGSKHGGIDPALFDTPFKEAKQHMVDSFERAYFGKLLEKTDGNLSRASAEAGITRYYLRELLKRLGMHKSQTDAS